MTLRSEKALGGRGREALLIGPALLAATLSIPLVVLSLVFSPTQSSAQSNGDQPIGELQALKRGEGVERHIVGKQKDRYQLAPGVGEYVPVVLEPHDIELLATVSGPDRQQILEADTSDTPSGTISISWIAKEPGVYEVEIEASQEGDAGGSYKIELGQMQAATAQQITQCRAEAIFLHGEELRRQGTEASLRAALEQYDQSIELWRESGDDLNQAEALNKAGYVRNSLGENQKAADLLEQALQIARASGDPLQEATILHDLGETYNDLSQKQKSLDFLSKALELRHNRAGASREADTLNDIGAVYDDLGEKRKGIDYYNQALVLKRQIGDHQSEATILSNIGVVYDDLGERQKALENYLAALPVLHQPRYRGSTLNNIAKVYQSIGETQNALEYYQKALADLKTAGDYLQEGRVLSNIGALYIDVGDDQNAIEYLNRALPVRHAAGDRRGEAYTLRYLGESYHKSGQDQKALDCLNESLSLLQPIGDRKGEAATLEQIARVHSSLGDKLEAVGQLNRALSVSDAIGDRGRMTGILNALGEIRTQLGETDKALENYTRARSVARDVNDPDAEAEALYGMARVEQQIGGLEDARTHVEAALALIESLRTKIAGSQLRSSFFSARQHPFQLDVGLLMQMHQIHSGEGYDARALEASERARARGLIDLLAESSVNIRQGVDPQLLSREHHLQVLVEAKSERQVRVLSGSHTERQAAQMKQELADLILQYQEVEGQIRADSPRYAALTQPEPLKLADIQKEILEPDTVVLEYSLGEDHSYLWAVTSTSLASFELPSRGEVETAARRVYELLTARNLTVEGETTQATLDRRAQAEAEYPRAAATLSRMVLGPVSQLFGSKRLVIVSDGALQYIPFAALPTPGRDGTTERAQPLMTEHEVVNLPSASALAVLRRQFGKRRAASKAVAVVADPVFELQDPRVRKMEQGESAPPKNSTPQEKKSESPVSASLESSRLARSATDVGTGGGGMRWPRLVFSRQEAASILSVTAVGEGMEALDFQASRATAMSPQLAHYRIIHFATHGLLDSEHPELSGLVLSLVSEEGQPENGFLELQDIYNLNLPAELVVLSACETGLGKEVKGEGLIGLTRGFMYAGSPRVVASLWKVDDVATAELMQRFYHGMLKENLRPAAALRQAQMEMWKQKRWALPYYWAAFTIQGEWK